MKKKKILLGILSIIGILSITIGVSVAFFNYTRTGAENTLNVGRISFNSSQDGRINLTNIFPIDPEESEVMNDNTKVGTVAITVAGDTTYTGGIEYLVSATNVTNTIGTGVNQKTIPISISATASGTLGTSDDDYFEDRETATSHIYKVLAKDTINNNDQLMVGYIASGSAGINGTITIKAYLDKDKIAISDTYDETESNNMGTTNNWVDGRMVLTTSEWNNLNAGGLSFQVKVEANEGIWVKGTLRSAIIAMNKGVADNREGNTFFTQTALQQGVNSYGVYQLQDVPEGSEPIYFFRGDHTVNNNVIFNGYCWLIVRTTETGGTRMIYNGLPVGNHCSTTTEVVENGQISGTPLTSISMYEKTISNQNSNYLHPDSNEDKSDYTLKNTFMFNTNASGNKYVGFKYKTVEDDDTNSNLKNVLDAWYSDAITAENKNKIENSVYCNDRTNRVDGAVTYYGGFDRSSTSEPSLTCNISDQYTAEVGFLTIDEVAMAGRTWSTGMQDYLFNGYYYWLGSPYKISGGKSMVFTVHATATTLQGANNVNTARGVRPVITLKKDVTYEKGDGSKDYPYVIDIQNNGGATGVSNYEIYGSNTITMKNGASTSSKYQLIQYDSSSTSPSGYTLGNDLPSWEVVSQTSDITVNNGIVTINSTNTQDSFMLKATVNGTTVQKQIEVNTIPTELLSTVTLHENEYADHTTGEIISNASTYTRTDYILCDSSKTLLLALNYGSQMYPYVAFYDDNNEFISGLGSQVSNSDYHIYNVNDIVVYGYVVPIPATAKKMIINVNKNDYNSDKINYYYVNNNDIELSTSSLTYPSVSTLSGLNIVNFGDSIFGIERNNMGISSYMQSYYGSTNYNVGFGNTGIANIASANNFNYFSMNNLVDAILSNDYTNQDANNNLQTYYADHLATLKSIDFSTIDYVTLGYGVNDWSRGVPIENYNLLDINTYKGAVRYSINKLRELNPNLKIVLIIPIYNSESNSDYLDATNNGRSMGYLTEYGTALKEIAIEYSDVFVYDAFNDVGFDGTNKYIFFNAGDRVHPLENGIKLYAYKLGKFIEGLEDQ